MNRIPLLLFLTALALQTSCSQKEDEAVVSTEKSKTAPKKSRRVMGRGVIMDPRRAKPMLEKTRAATEAMSKSGQDTQAELDKLK